MGDDPTFFKAAFSLRSRSSSAFISSSDMLSPNWLFVRRTGGESGIRTHDTVSRIHAFQACALSHSAISPAPLSWRRTRRFASREMGLIDMANPAGFGRVIAGQFGRAVAECGRPQELEQRLRARQ